MKETTSGGLVKAFRLIWAVIKLNLFFVLFTMMGAVLFGVGPAFQTISDLIEEEGLSYEDQTLGRPFAAGSKTFGISLPLASVSKSLRIFYKSARIGRIAITGANHKSYSTGSLISLAKSAKSHGSFKIHTRSKLLPS